MPDCTRRTRPATAFAERCRNIAFQTIATPVPVLNDQNYSAFDPFARRELLAAEVYDVTFGPLLDKVRGGISTKASPNPSSQPGG